MLLADKFLKLHEHFPRDECGCRFAVLTDYRLMCDGCHVGELLGFGRFVASKFRTLGEAVDIASWLSAGLPLRMKTYSISGCSLVRLSISEARAVMENFFPSARRGEVRARRRMRVFM